MDNLESIKKLFREFLQSLNIHITDEFFDTIIQDNLQKGAYTLYLLGDYLTNIPHLYETSKAPLHTCLSYSKYFNVYKNITQPISNFSSVITTGNFNYNGLEIIVVYNNIFKYSDSSSGDIYIDSFPPCSKITNPKAGIYNTCTSDAKQNCRLNGSPKYENDIRYKYACMGLPNNPSKSKSSSYWWVNSTGDINTDISAFVGDSGPMPPYITVNGAMRGNDGNGLGGIQSNWIGPFASYGIIANNTSSSTFPHLQMAGPIWGGGSLWGGTLVGKEGRGDLQVLPFPYYYYYQSYTLQIPNTFKDKLFKTNRWELWGSTTPLNIYLGPSGEVNKSIPITKFGQYKTPFNNFNSLNISGITLENHPGIMDRKVLQMFNTFIDGVIKYLVLICHNAFVNTEWDGWFLNSKEYYNVSLDNIEETLSKPELITFVNNWYQENTKNISEEWNNMRDASKNNGYTGVIPPIDYLTAYPSDLSLIYGIPHSTYSSQLHYEYWVEGTVNQPNKKKISSEEWYKLISNNIKTGGLDFSKIDNTRSPTTLPPANDQQEDPEKNIYKFNKPNICKPTNITDDGKIINSNNFSLEDVARAMVLGGLHPLDTPAGLIISAGESYWSEGRGSNVIGGAWQITNPDVIPLGLSGDWYCTGTSQSSIIPSNKNGIQDTNICCAALMNSTHFYHGMPNSVSTAGMFRYAGGYCGSDGTCGGITKSKIPCCLNNGKLIPPPAPPSPPSPLCTSAQTKLCSSCQYCSGLNCRSTKCTQIKGKYCIPKSVGTCLGPNSGGNTIVACENGSRPGNLCDTTDSNVHIWPPLPPPTPSPTPCSSKNICTVLTGSKCDAGYTPCSPWPDGEYSSCNSVSASPTCWESCQAGGMSCCCPSS